MRRIELTGLKWSLGFAVREKGLKSEGGNAIELN